MRHVFPPIFLLLLGANVVMCYFGLDYLMWSKAASIIFALFINFILFCCFLRSSFEMLGSPNEMEATFRIIAFAVLISSAVLDFIGITMFAGLKSIFTWTSSPFIAILSIALPYCALVASRNTHRRGAYLDKNEELEKETGHTVTWRVVKIAEHKRTSANENQARVN